MRARVGHAPIKKELKEVISEIVVFEDVSTGSATAIAPQFMTDPVEYKQQVGKRKSTSYIASRFDVDDQPGKNADDIRAFPVIIDEGFTQPDLAVEDTSFEEDGISNGQRSRRPRQLSPVNLLLAGGQSDAQCSDRKRRKYSVKEFLIEGVVVHGSGSR